MQVLSKSKAKAGSGIQQRGKSSCPRNEWREAYRNARLQRRIERRFGLFMLSTTTHPVVWDSRVDSAAASASFRTIDCLPRDILALPRASGFRAFVGPAVRLP